MAENHIDFEDLSHDQLYRMTKECQNLWTLKLKTQKVVKQLRYDIFFAFSVDQLLQLAWLQLNYQLTQHR